MTVRKTVFIPSEDEKLVTSDDKEYHLAQHRNHLSLDNTVDECVIHSDTSESQMTAEEREKQIKILVVKMPYNKQTIFLQFRLEYDLRGFD